MKVDIQLLMRIFLEIRLNYDIEKDIKISKFNFSSQMQFSINKAILKKRLLYDSSIQTKLPTVQVVTDLSACYDRQLANVESMVLKSVGINRLTLRVFAKVLLRLMHHICTSFGISEKYIEVKMENMVAQSKII